MKRIAKTEEKTTQHFTERKTSSPKELCTLAESRIFKAKEAAEKRVSQRLAELEENIKKSEARLARQKEFLKAELEIKKKQKEVQNKIREENLARQQRKEEYRKLKKLTIQKAQAEKLQKVQEARANLLSQGGYMKLANELRKFYLKKEMEGNKTRCLTVDKLMDINEKFGSASTLQLSLDVDPTQVKKKMVHILSDPFSTKNRNFRNTVSGSVNNNRLFVQDDIFTPQVPVRSELNLQSTPYLCILFMF
eukprot:TRINITY_DN2366_c0_g1_i1.p3 TRINITY_DN2366_c0_g1~~TRINITY_DN2366_c0_g1_i1.p3  ORF type:complete len:250 (+),score=43.45 TRINITY_DN2366_c0_g1_i1:2743-3492(+)